MTVTTYLGWVNDGRPWKNCQPVNDFIATLRRHGYTGPGAGIGDQSHLTANPPEDHCPYSHTPWPGTQPYPYVMAIDIMSGEGLDIIDLGGRLFDDKSSLVPGTEPLKYINWTDTDGNCFHDSWMPNHTRFNSTDRGHIHMSFRTDYVTSNRMAIYDPYGGDVPLTDADAKLVADKVWATLVGSPSLNFAGPASEWLKYVKSNSDGITALAGKLDVILAKLEEGCPPLSAEDLEAVKQAAALGAAAGINGATITK